jgi:hypothetical protein
LANGNGNKAEFWEAAWLQGRAPRDLAPNLYKLAWRKHQTVQADLQNNNWTRGLWKMSTADEMAELISLWSSLETVTLNDQEDTIVWKWTANGQYTSKSAYQAQLLGSYCTFNSKAVWAAKVEDKHRFFAWLLIQCKLLTADRLIARNWPCNPVCSLCDQELESTEHMVLHCVFAQEVWNLVSQWTGGLVRIPSSRVKMEFWWNSSLKGPPEKTKQRVASLVIYTT